MTQLIVTGDDGQHHHLTVDDEDSELTHAGTLHGSGQPVDAGDTYESRVYWTPQSYFEDRWGKYWVGAGSVGPHPNEGGHGRIYVNQDNFWVNDYLIYHERGHNLGFRHHDGGLMSYDKPDIDSETLDETTITIAKNSDGLHILNWDDGRIHTLKQLSQAWRDGHISLDDMRYAIRAWRRGASSMELYSDGYLNRQLDTDTAKEVGQYHAFHSGGLYRPLNETRDGTMAWRQ